MFKRFKRSNLNKFLGHEAMAGEVTSSHAYGRVAKDNPTPPRAHRSAPARNRVVAGYRDSMVGSIAQYRERMPLPPVKPEETKKAQSTDGIIGNRPKSGRSEAQLGDASKHHRHHFVEPPKRNFTRFD